MLPNVYAWQWNTHQNIIEFVYLHLDQETQQKLNLTALREGAIIPDRDFKDVQFHHYPSALTEAKKWLNNDTDISLNLGIASHYITDSFVAAHNVKKEKPADHAKFENQVKTYLPNVDCKNDGSKLEDLEKATINAKDWPVWLKTKDKKIAEREVDEATIFLFSIILTELNASCRSKTNIIKTEFITNEKKIIITFIFFIGLFLLKVMSKKKKSEESKEVLLK